MRRNSAVALHRTPCHNPPAHLRRVAPGLPGSGEALVYLEDGESWIASQFRVWVNDPAPIAAATAFGL
jgi:hypothetical protein